MATTTQTLPSTAIELTAITQTPGERQRQTTTKATDPGDEVMQQSLIADSEVPDGGYGWILISACAVVTWWFVGASYTWGVMQAALVAQKGYSSSTLAFVGSLCPACISLLAVPNATVIRKIGARVTALLGIFLLGLGSILSGFATDNVAALFITWGVVGGLGTSFCFMVCFILFIPLCSIWKWCIVNELIGCLCHAGPVLQSQAWNRQWNRLCRRRTWWHCIELHPRRFTPKRRHRLDIPDLRLDDHRHRSTSSIPNPGTGTNSTGQAG